MCLDYRRAQYGNWVWVFGRNRKNVETPLPSTTSSAGISQRDHSPVMATEWVSNLFPVMGEWGEERSQWGETRGDSLSLSVVWPIVLYLGKTHQQQDDKRKVLKNKQCKPHSCLLVYSRLSPHTHTLLDFKPHTVSCVHPLKSLGTCIYNVCENSGTMWWRQHHKIIIESKCYKSHKLGELCELKSWWWW